MIVKCAQVLQKTKYLLDKEGWTKGCGARDKYGVPIQSYSPQAASFCLYIAFRRACTSTNIDMFTEKAAINILVSNLRGKKKKRMKFSNNVMGLMKWNDMAYRRKYHVINALNRAINAAERL